jgi:hypothetical protein
MKKAGLLLFFLFGCVHGSPNERILASLAEETAGSLFSREAAPEFVRFRDEIRASVYKDVAPGGRYRMAPDAQRLLCAGAIDPANHGYVLGVSVDKVMRDSALATVSQTCDQFVPECNAGQICTSVGNSVEHQSIYLLAKTRGKWKVVRQVSSALIL